MDTEQILNDYTPTPPLPSHWVEDHTYGGWKIRGAHCYIWMQARPAYCDRGSWLAHIELLPIPKGVRPPVHLDGADGWPRYYFDLDRARLEVEAWLKKRKQWVEPNGDA